VAIGKYLIQQDNLTPQQFLNGEVHDWYRIVHGFSDHLVARLLKQFHLSGSQRVLDPFCGAGTTLVECCKLKIDSVGIDANPSSCFAASVKTDWGLRPSKLLALLPQVAVQYKRLIENPSSLKTDATYKYIFESGMLQRKWIGNQRLLKAIAIKRAINKVDAKRTYKQALHLALMTEVVNTASNVRFGPELYCGEPRKYIDLLVSFRERVREMSRDLGVMRDMGGANAKVLQGDARSCSLLLKRKGYRRFHAVICSPPYPAEHDYTRNSRLELAFLEAVDDRRSLQKIKRRMIRSHTKNIYEGDHDGDLVKDSRVLDKIANRIKQKIKTKTHGFARLYPKVLLEYFGGMKRHFEEVIKVLSPGAHCAYVVGDQSSYLRVHVPTAKILGELAKKAGFQHVQITRWRSRWSTTTSRSIDENILVMQKPKVRAGTGSRRKRERRHGKK
jgi:DNA methylase